MQSKPYREDKLQKTIKKQSSPVEKLEKRIAKIIRFHYEQALKKLNIKPAEKISEKASGM